MPTVLVVDDSAVDRQLVGQLLADDTRITVWYAADGAEALRQVAAETPDLIITDLVMPRMDGLELVAAVRQRYPLVPVVLMTSQGSEEVAVQALRAGAASYVPKAAIIHYLSDTVAQVLAASSRQRGQARLLGRMTRSESTFRLENDPALFGPLVAYLQDGGAQMGLWRDAERTRVGVALEEALANALYHGNLEIGSELREQDAHEYYRLINERRRQSPYQDRCIEIEASLSAGRGTFVIRDSGPGFNPSRLPDPTDPANLDRAAGRGILLMRAFMDEVRYNAQGNAVTLIKYRQST